MKTQKNVRENRRGNQELTIQKTGNIGYTRHKTNKAKHTTQKTEKMSSPAPTKNHVRTSCLLLDTMLHSKLISETRRVN